MGNLQHNKVVRKFNDQALRNLIKDFLCARHSWTSYTITDTIEFIFTLRFCDSDKAEAELQQDILDWLNTPERKKWRELHLGKTTDGLD